jgi:hypothetical protein
MAAFRSLRSPIVRVKDAWPGPTGERGAPCQTSESATLLNRDQVTRPARRKSPYSPFVKGGQRMVKVLG